MIRPFFTEFIFTQALRRVIYISLIVGAYTLVPLSLHYIGSFSNVERLSAGLETFLGAVLSLLLVFRANRAYERWWEARTQWGVLVNVSRNLAIKIKNTLDPDVKDCAYFYQLISQFCISLKDHLRNKPRYGVLSDDLSVAEEISNIPVYLCDLIYAKLEDYRAAGKLSEVQFLMLDTDLSRFMHVSGACEKIKNTLISLSYRSFVHHIMIILFIFLPWKLVDSYENWSIPLVIMIAYITFALEGIARHMEEPFGNSVDDVHMEQICQTIARSASQVLLR